MSGSHAPSPDSAFLIAKILGRLRALGWSVGTGESVTGGMVISGLVGAPGASASVRGGVVAYGTDLKSTLLSVAPELLAEVGPVDAKVAAAMARGAARVLGASVGVATTGVAGPDTQDGVPIGTVHVACFVASDASCQVRSHAFAGSRTSIREQATGAALSLLSDCLGS